jgi:glycosyltransferase involved in cell wall biosynthesis
MLSDPFITFVLSCFNVEGYVSKAIDSILHQDIKSSADFTNSVEIICINDGSTDGTLAILQRYSHQYKQISVISQENQGLSAVRNLGLSIAKGKYLCFLDSDDWISNNFIEEIVKSDRYSPFDLALVNAKIYDQVTKRYYPFYDDAHFNYFCKPNQSLAISPRIHPDLFRFEPNTSRRIIRTRFARFINMKYPIGLLYEDFPIHFFTLIFSGDILLINKPLFFYRIGKPGKLTECNDNRRFDVIKIFSQTATILQEQDASAGIIIAFMRVMSRTIPWCISSVPKRVMQHFDKETKKLFSSFPSNWTKIYFLSSHIGKREKVRIFLMKYGFFSRYISMSEQKRNKINESLLHLSKFELWNFARKITQAVRVR